MFYGKTLKLVRLFQVLLQLLGDLIPRPHAAALQGIPFPKVFLSRTPGAPPLRELLTL